MMPGTKMDDAKNTIDGDFDNVFRCYYRPLCLYALHYLTDVDVAEDIVQECFAQLWERLKRGDEVSETKNYLYSMVRNRCIDSLKSNDVVDKSVALEDIDIADDDDYEERSELEAKMWTAIDSLPEGCRQVLLLCKRDGMKYEEVAEQLSISVNTVKNQMSKALKILKGEGDKVYSLFLSIIFP
jgi:RNA polymerase sigma-70 factor (ECF subfamily)